jgi:hypothetical protein
MILNLDELNEIEQPSEVYDILYLKIFLIITARFLKDVDNVSDRSSNKNNTLDQEKIIITQDSVIIFTIQFILNFNFRIKQLLAWRVTDQYVPQILKNQPPATINKSRFIILIFSQLSNRQKMK